MYIPKDLPKISFILSIFFHEHCYNWKDIKIWETRKIFGIVFESKMWQVVFFPQENIFFHGRKRFSYKYISKLLHFYELFTIVCFCTNIWKVWKTASLVDRTSSQYVIIQLGLSMNQLISDATTWGALWKKGVLKNLAKLKACNFIKKGL